MGFGICLKVFYVGGLSGHFLSKPLIESGTKVKLAESDFILFCRPERYQERMTTERRAC